MTDGNASDKAKDRSSVATAGEAEARGQCGADVVVGICKSLFPSLLVSVRKEARSSGGTEEDEQGVW